MFGTFDALSFNARVNYSEWAAFEFGLCASAVPATLIAFPGQIDLVVFVQDLFEGILDRCICDRCIPNAGQFLFAFLNTGTAKGGTGALPHWVAPPSSAHSFRAELHPIQCGQWFPATLHCFSARSWSSALTRSGRARIPPGLHCSGAHNSVRSKSLPM